MHKPDPIEDILSRLMPPALSEEGQKSMETMIDELASEAPPVSLSGEVIAHPWNRRLIAGGIAAAIAALAALMVPAKKVPDLLPVASNLEEMFPAEFVLVSESDRIESSTDEGLVEDSDGSTMRALRISVVEENSIRDEETGIVMQVSEPREEILLMPVSAF